MTNARRSLGLLRRPGAWRGLVAKPGRRDAGDLHLRREAGRRWLDSLPAQVASCCAGWGLTLDGAPMHGGLSLVVPVHHGDEPAVLKLVWAEADAAQEALALAAWGGCGAAPLLAAEPERRALLLERLDHRRTLGAVPSGEAFAVAGGLLRRLAVPAPVGVPRLAAVAAELAAALPERWEWGGRPSKDVTCEMEVARTRQMGMIGRANTRYNPQELPCPPRPCMIVPHRAQPRPAPGRGARAALEGYRLRAGDPAGDRAASAGARQARARHHQDGFERPC
jgi:Aminoglycoside/hydroxyurea antibiotic resistance kinase